MPDDADAAVHGAAAGPRGAAAPARAGDPLTRWGRAVELGARGHYAAAAAVLERLRTEPGTPPAVRAHAAVTRAAHLRQLGGHRFAAVLDGRGLHLARAAAPVPPSAGRPGPRVAADAVADALVGLAADAKGRWDTATARRLLDRAEPWCVGAGRPEVRWHWVRAETSLIGRDPAAAAAAGEDAVRAAGDLGSPRHLLKSRLVRAVARSVAGPGAGPPPDGLPELDRIAQETAVAGLLPLHRAALLAAADAADAWCGGPGVTAAAADVHAAGRAETVASDGDPTPTGAPERPNERHAGTSRLSTLGRRADAQRRRHAAEVASNVLYLRSDPLGRQSIRESAWIFDPIAVRYGLLHSATHHPHDVQSSRTRSRMEGTNSPRPCQGESVTRRFGG